MSRIVGIDLGTTNSLVATVDSGIPLVLADAQGRRLTPSVVHFPADGSEPLVGEPARRVLALHPDRTFYSVKRFIGRRGNEISPGDAAVNYGLDLDGTRPAKLRLGSGSLLPEEVSAKVLAKLKADAEAALGETIDRAVITVPAYFNDAQRQATLRAAELAGLTVERIINEPTAAALCYGLNRLKERSKVAVYDLGGGTFDLSILELTEGVFQVLATHGDTRLGGDDIDRAIIDWLRVGIRARGGPDLSNDPAAMARLREAAESAKIALSTQDSFRVELPFLSQAFNFDAELSRATLESIASAVVERTREHCLHALKDAKLTAADLDQVILVGGQTRMPLVRRKVAEWFACSDFETVSGNLSFKEEEGGAGGRRGPRLNTGQNPDEAIALGAAIQAEILSGGLRSVLLLDVTPLSLGLETFGGLMNVLIPRNTTIPVKAGEVFTNAVDGQREMMIHVLQGERDRAEHNWSLGRFNLEFEPSPRGVARVGVQFEIDANGVLHVLARDIKTGAERRVPMRSAVDVDDADVQRMVEESVDHAFEDLHARRWIEAKLRSVEAVEATRTALEELHDQLSEELRSQAVRALEAVEQVLALEDPQTRVGDVDALKRAALELDQATQPMADLLIDRAMEEALRQRGLVP